MKLQWTKKWTVITLLVLFTIVLAGCGGGGTNTVGASADLVDDGSEVTIQYWHSHAENQMDGLNYMIEEFKKTHPHITVEPVYQGAYGELHQKLQAAVVAGDVPAVTNVEVSSLPNFAEGGIFMDLTELVDRDVPREDFSEGMLNSYAFNDRQFGFPLIVSTSVFIYNKTLLDELGVTPPQTWDEIEDYLDKVAIVDNGETTRYGFAIPGWDVWYYDPWLINGGGSILNEEMTEARINEPESLRYLENFYEWLQAGKIQMGYGKGASNNMRQMFLDGEIAMVSHSSAIIKTYVENADFEVGVSFIPGDVKRESNIGGAGIVIMDGAPEREKAAAWEFVKHMTSAEHNIKWAEYVGYLPTRKSAFESAEGERYFEDWPQYKAVFDNFDNVTPRLQHPAYPEFRTAYLEVVGEMILNGVDPLTMIDDAAKQINEILAEFD